MYNKKMCRNIGIAVLLFGFNAILGMNLTNSVYDTLILPERNYDSRFQFFVAGQMGIGKAVAFDCCGCEENPLRIWNKTQNSIKMLEGFDPDSHIGLLRSGLDANDDGTRGHFLVCGELDINAAVDFSMWFYFLENFSVSLHLPFYSMELKNVSWQDQTRMASRDDFKVKESLTNNFFQNVKNLGCLDLCGWKRNGIGDLAVFVEWQKYFEQGRPFLKDVTVGVRGGLTLPTGKKEDEDKLFAVPFGYDGSVGMIVGAGLDLTFKRYLRGGVDFQLLHLFGREKCRRIKTHQCQTDLLLLQKFDTYKDFGLTQRFNLYLELYRFLKDLSFKVGYQFMRRSEDFLHLCNNKFSECTANTSNRLEEWTMHSLILNLHYQLREDDCREYRVRPYVSVFSKIPFNGMNVAMKRTIGVGFGLDF